MSFGIGNLLRRTPSLSQQGLPVATRSIANGGTLYGVFETDKKLPDGTRIWFCPSLNKTWPPEAEKSLAGRVSEGAKDFDISPNNKEKETHEKK